MVVISFLELTKKKERKEEICNGNCCHKLLGINLKEIKKGRNI